MTLQRGRFFNSADNDTSENVAVVNEGFVKRFFKNNEDPLDQHFGLDMPENVSHASHRRKLCEMPSSRVTP